MLPSRLKWALFSVVSTLVVGTAGYWIIGGGEWSLVDCLYQTVIGVTTAGFGEVIPLSGSPYGRPFTMLLLLGGLVAVGWFVTTAAAVLIEGELLGLRWRKRMEKQVKKLSQHVVVCGAGTTGVHVIRELAATGTPFVVVEAKEQVAREISTEIGCPVVIGDATHDDSLIEAGIERARGVIAALTDDRDNLYVTVTARALNPTARIVSKAIDDKAEAKLRRAGADSVVFPNRIGGMRMVSEMVRPEVVSFLDVMLREKDRTLRIDEIPVAAGSQLDQRRVSEIDFGGHGLLLLAAKQTVGGSPRYVYTPGPDHLVEGGHVLIVLGEPDRVRQLSGEAAAR
jgi:voltage-gated potassium channel